MHPYGKYDNHPGHGSVGEVAEGAVVTEARRFRSLAASWERTAEVVCKMRPQAT